MPTSVIIDCVLGAVVVLFAYLGWKRGFFRTLAELAVVVVALFLAAQIANAATPEVADRFLRPAAHEAIEARLEDVWRDGGPEGSVQDVARQLVEAIPNEFLRSHAMTILEEGGLYTAVSYTKAAAFDLGSKAVDAALDGVVYNLIHSLLYAISFMALTFLLRLAVRALNLTMKLPVLRQLNEFCGLLVGVGKGLILAFLATWVLWTAGVLTEEVVEASFLARLVVQTLGLTGAAPA